VRSSVTFYVNLEKKNSYFKDNFVID